MFDNRKIKIFVSDSGIAWSADRSILGQPSLVSSSLFFGLNSVTKNRPNFFIQANIKFLLTGSESVDKSEFEAKRFSSNFLRMRYWNCGGWVHMRGRVILKIIQNHSNILTLIILIYEVTGTYLIPRPRKCFQVDFWCTIPRK